MKLTLIFGYVGMPKKSTFSQSHVKIMLDCGTLSSHKNSLLSAFKERKKKKRKKKGKELGDIPQGILTVPSKTGELEIGSVVECDGEMCVIYRKTRRKRKR